MPFIISIPKGPFAQVATEQNGKKASGQGCQMQQTPERIGHKPDPFRILLSVSFGYFLNA